MADVQALIGKSFGAYTLQELIGNGKVSAVFLTQQAAQQPPTALKILLPVTSRTPVERAAFLERFRQKMDVLATMQHPNMLPIYDHGECDGFAYLVMPYMSNGTLRSLMEQADLLPLSVIADYLDQIASALDYAHEQTVFHRDLTPTNILIAPDGQLLVADFGLTDIVLERRISQLRLLKGGLFIGSPAYMAPEQIMGDSVDARSDIYALGVLLFQMVTGRLPFQGETPLETAALQVQVTPPSPCSLRADVPIAAEQVILRTLAKRPAERFMHVQDVARAFRVALTATETLSQAIPPETIASVIGSTSTDDVATFQEAVTAHQFARHPQTSKATRVLPAAAPMLSLASQSAPVTIDDANINQSLPAEIVSPTRNTPLPLSRPRLARTSGILRPMEPIATEAEKDLLEEQRPAQVMDTGERHQAISEQVMDTGERHQAISEQAMDTGERQSAIIEQTTEGTVKLTGAVKILQVPVAGQPGRYVTGLLPVLPETEQPEGSFSGSATNTSLYHGSLVDRAKRLPQRFTSLSQRQKIASVSLIVLLILVGSSLLAIPHSHSGTAPLRVRKVSSKQHVPDVQATLAAQATATVQANDILTDSLSQNIHNWPISQSGSQQFFFANGTYHVVDNDSKQSAPSLLPGIVLQEPLTYRLSMEEIKGNQDSINNSFGMILYFTAQSKAGHTVDTFYSFEVVNIKGGQYQFWKYDSGKSASPWTSLWHHTFGGEFHQGEGSKNINTFVVSVNNSVFTFTVNGKKVGSLKDSSFTSGQVGMLVNLNGTEVAYSNLSLTYQ